MVSSRSIDEKNNNNGRIILAIDASSDITSVSISNGLKIIVSKDENSMGACMKKLLCIIDEALDSAKLLLEEIDIFALTVGPGRFTGIRNSLSTVKALSMSMNKPVVCVPTLHAIAYKAGTSSFTCSLIPANKDDVFVQQFSVDSELNVKALYEVKVMNIHKLLESVRTIEKIRWAGKGAIVHSRVIAEYANGVFRNRTQSDHQISVRNHIFGGWYLDEQKGNLSDSVISLANKMSDANQTCKANDVRACYGL